MVKQPPLPPVTAVVAEQPPPPPPPVPVKSNSGSWVRLAGVLMAVMGTFGVIEGIIALFNRYYFLTDAYGNVWALNIAGWAWLHIILGLAVAFAGAGLLKAPVPTWARVVGIIVVSLNLLVSFVWLPVSPLWSILVIVIDVLILAALVTYTDHEKVHY